MSEEREPQGEDQQPKRLDRSADLLGRKTSRLRKKLVEIWNDVRRGYENQARRSDHQADYWDAYNCRFNGNQFYNGEAEIYVPAIRDAINARATRFVNQLFPQGGQYVEAVSTDGSVNGPIVSLLDQYISDARLKTDLAKALCRCGDIEGQYNVYVDWEEMAREIVSRVSIPATMEGMPIPGEEIDDIEVEEIFDARPAAEVLHDSDVLVRPESADTVEKALAGGGLVAIVRRWSKAKIRRLAEAGLVRQDAADELEEMMTSSAGKEGMPENIPKLLAETVGIQAKGAEATVYEVWHRLPLGENGAYSEDGVPRLCRIFIGPSQLMLGCVRNPNWNDRCPLLSVPVEKVAGVFKGMSQVEPVISLQYEANDAANEGADSAHYSAAPVVFRDPASGNEPIVLNVGSIIDVPPNAIKFAEFPDLTPRAIARIQYCIGQIFQTLGVNPSMLPQQTSQTRRNQAQIAQEQQVDLLTTAEAVSVLEGGIFTPLIGWWVDLDYQHRDRELSVKTHGAMGIRANMQDIPPFKTREYYRFRWWGADQARFNAMQYQQMIAWLNVATGLAPQLAQEGKRINFTPILESSAAAIFGPKYAGLVIEDIRAQLSIPADVENELLAQGDDVPISIFDQDAEHIQSHQRAMMQRGGDPRGTFRVHIQRHTLAMGAKQQATVMQEAAAMLGPQQQQGRGGSRAGRPQPGGQVQAMRPSRGPPGMIHPDAMPAAGGISMPRKY